MSEADKAALRDALGVNAGGDTPEPAGPDYVDMGLPSGTLWATCNLGASSPEEYGDYYTWGEIVPKETSAYTIEGYRFYNNRSEYTKYNSTDNKTTLDLEDDVANVVMGGEWHMPSKAQLNELTANTTSSWTTDYNGTGVAGAIVTSNNNGNSIFLPAAGGIFDGTFMGQGETFYTRSSYNDWGCLLGAEGETSVGGLSPQYGFSVRGVLGELSDTGGDNNPQK